MDERRSRPSRLAERWIGLALCGATLAAGAVLGRPWLESGLPGETAQVHNKAATGVLVLALLALAYLSPLRRARRLRGILELLAVALGVCSYLNFGTFHHGRFTNPHESFHYFLGAKYFGELGYDGLYVASVAAQRERDVAFPIGPLLRDLRNNRVVPESELAAHRAEVVARFSPERWARFVEDHHYFVLQLGPRLERVRLDHGYNPSPAWTFVGKLLADRLPAAPISFRIVAALDIALLAGAFAVLFRTFPRRAAVLAVAIVCLGYGWRFYYVGGAFLRMDWIAATLLALCGLERRRPALAGALLGYATAVRLFPVFFLLGPALAALRSAVRGERGLALRLGAGFCGVLLLAVLAGGTTGRGLGAWAEFASDADLHRQTFPPNRVGLDNVLLYAPSFLAAERLDAPLPTPEPGRATPAAALGIFVKAGVLAALGLALWKATLVQSALLGVVANFALVPLGSYYWMMLLVTPLGGATRVAFALLALSTTLYAAHGLADGPQVRYAWKSLGLALILVGWVLPAPLGGLRDLARTLARRRAHGRRVNQPDRGRG